MRKAALATVAATILTNGAGATSIAGVAMPTRPLFDATSYPQCALEYTKINRFEARVQSVQDCINELEAFNRQILPDYVRQMKTYVGDLQRLSAATIKNRRLTWAARQEVTDYVRAETLNSDGNTGTYFTKYRYYVDRYKSQLNSLIAVRQRQQFPTN